MIAQSNIMKGRIIGGSYTFYELQQGDWVQEAEMNEVARQEGVDVANHDKPEKEVKVVDLLTVTHQT